jgi:hypothetical protein
MCVVPIYIKSEQSTKDIQGSGVIVEIEGHVVLSTCKHVFDHNRHDRFYTIIEGNEIIIGPGTEGYLDDPAVPELKQVPFPPDSDGRALIIDDVAYQIFPGLSKTYAAELIDSESISEHDPIELRTHHPQTSERETITLNTGNSYECPRVNYPPEKSLMPIVLNMVKLAEARVRQGHSGSPVLLVDSNSVIGLLRENIRYGADYNTCIIRSEYVKQRFLELLRRGLKG